MLWRAFRQFHRISLVCSPRRGPLLDSRQLQRIRCRSTSFAIQARALRHDLHINTPTPSASTNDPTTHGIPEEDADQSTLSTSLPSQTSVYQLKASGKSDTQPTHPHHISSQTPLLTSKTSPKHLTDAANMFPQPAAEIILMTDALHSRCKFDDDMLPQVLASTEFRALVEELSERERAVKLAVLMANTEVPARARFILRVAHKLGCKFKQNAYERVAYQLAQLRKWEEIPATVALGKQHTGRTTTRLLNWRARALVELSQYRLLDRVLTDFGQEKVQPNQRTFHVLMSGHLRNRNLGRARECLDWMQDAGFPLDAATHALFVTQHRSLGMTPATQNKALHSLSELNARSGTKVLNSLIQVSLDMDDVESAMRHFAHFDTMEDEDPSVTSATQRFIRQGARSSAHTASGKQRAAQPLRPDIVTFTIFMNYAARTHNLDLGRRTLEWIRAYSPQPDSYLVAAFIRFYCVTGDLNTALDIAATMCRTMPEVLGSLRYLGWNGRWTDLVSEHVKHTPFTVNVLLKGLLAHHGIVALKPALRFMHLLGIRPNAETAENVLSFLAKTRRLREKDVWLVKKALLPDSRCSLRYAQILFATIVRDRRQRLPIRAWRYSPPPLLSQDDSDADHPDTPTHVSKHPLRRLLMPTLKSAARRSATFNHSLTHVQMRYIGVVERRPRAARAMLQDMLDRGVQPNIYHYAAIIDAFCRAGDMVTAEKELQAAMKAGFGRGPFLYTILIYGYGRLGLWEEASDVFERMLLNNVQPDVRAVDALSRAHYSADRFLSSRNVLERYWSKFAPFPPELATAQLHVLASAFRKLDKKPRVHMKGRVPSMREFKLQRRILRRIVAKNRIRGDQP